MDLAMTDTVETPLPLDNIADRSVLIVKARP